MMTASERGESIEISRLAVKRLVGLMMVKEALIGATVMSVKVQTTAAVSQAPSLNFGKDVDQHGSPNNASPITTNPVIDVEKTLVVGDGPSPCPPSSNSL